MDKTSITKKKRRRKFAVKNFFQNLEGQTEKGKNPHYP